MTREQAHNLVDAAFDFAGGVIEPRGSAGACRHLSAARREALLGVRALIDIALTRTAPRPRGDDDTSGPRHVPID